MVGHVVVEGKVPHGHPVQLGLPLQGPVPGAEFPPHPFQVGGLGLSPPVGLQGEFQFPLGAHTGKAQDMGGDHGGTSVWKSLG